MDTFLEIPEAKVLSDPGDLAPFRQDESHLRGVPPLAVVKPNVTRVASEFPDGVEAARAIPKRFDFKDESAGL